MSFACEINYTSFVFLYTMCFFFVFILDFMFTAEMLVCCWDPAVWMTIIQELLRLSCEINVLLLKEELEFLLYSCKDKQVTKTIQPLLQVKLMEGEAKLLCFLLISVWVFLFCL